jgi:hypothetical protein
MNKAIHDDVKTVDGQIDINKLNSLSSRRLNLGLKQEEKKEAKQRAKMEEDNESEDLIGESLYLFPADGKVRRVLYKVVTNRKFEIFMILVILLSSIELAINGPL